MHPYHIFKNELAPILVAAGFVETEEAFHPNDFGSAFSKFERNEFAVRIIWDGKDGIGRIDFLNYQENPEWEGISAFVNEEIEVNKELDGRLGLVKDELKKILKFIE